MTYIDKARYAGEQVEFHRVKMGEWAANRARNIARAAEQDDPNAVAEALGVSRSAVYKAINAERERLIRVAWDELGDVDAVAERVHQDAAAVRKVLGDLVKESESRAEER